jgi:hypothetical protein
MLGGICIKECYKLFSDEAPTFSEHLRAATAAQLWTANAGTANRVAQIVIRPPMSPGFGSSLAVGKVPSDSSLRNDSKIKWRRGWDSNPRAGITRPSDFESAPL